MSPIVVRLTDVPGFAALQGLGHRILGLALLLWLGVETYKLVTRGQCDYLTPVLRVGLGSALLASLPSLHATATSLFDGAASDLADANVLGLFVTAYEHMLQGATGGPASAGQAPGFLDTVALVGQVFSFQGMMALGSVGLAVAMLVAKVLIIDLLWPLCLGLVMVLGTLAVPLGVLPGLGTLKGWLKNLIEVALWPVIFQLVVGLMASSFKGLLTAVRQVDFLQVFSDPTAPGDQLLLLTRWWALCLLYVLLLLLTPLLSMMVVRSTPVGVVGGIVAAQAARLAAGAVGGLAGGGLGKFVAGAAGRLAGAGASGAGAAGLATASAVVGQVAGATTAGASGGPSLDRRTHRTAAPPPPSPKEEPR
jgi:hypothetical protein